MGGWVSQYERERAQYRRDSCYRRDREDDMRNRPQSYGSRVHVPLGVFPRSLNGAARYEARRTQLYYRDQRVEMGGAGGSDAESGEMSG